MGKFLNYKETDKYDLFIPTSLVFPYLEFAIYNQYVYQSVSSMSVKSSKEMCSLYFFVAFLLLPRLSIQSSLKPSVDFHVGVILDLNSTDSAVGRIGMGCLSVALSDFYSFHKDY